MANNDIVGGFDDGQDEGVAIRLERVGGVERCLVLYLDGHIDTYNSTSFQKRVGRVIDAGFVRLVFHCGELQSLPSTGVGSFAVFLKAVRLRGGDMVLLETRSEVFEVFRLLGFERTFTFRETLEGSVDFFRRGLEGGETFPRTFLCPVCAQKLTAMNPGRFRCGGCEAVLSVDAAGRILAG